MFKIFFMIHNVYSLNQLINYFVKSANVMAAAQYIYFINGQWFRQSTRLENSDKIEVPDCVTVVEICLRI